MKIDVPRFQWETVVFYICIVLIGKKKYLLGKNILVSLKQDFE